MNEAAVHTKLASYTREYVELLEDCLDPAGDFTSTLSIDAPIEFAWSQLNRVDADEWLKAATREALCVIIRRLETLDLDPFPHTLTVRNPGERKFILSLWGAASDPRLPLEKTHYGHHPCVGLFRCWWTDPTTTS